MDENQKHVVDGVASKQEDPEAMVSKRISSEIQKNQEETRKLKLEALEIKKRINQKWYSARAFFQAMVGGIVAAGLLTAWSIGYLNPLLKKKQELSVLEVQKLALQAQIQEKKNILKQSELTELSKRLEGENHKIKKDLETLVKHNAILEKEQKDMEEGAQKLLLELEKTKAQYAKLSNKYALTVNERENYNVLIEKTNANINELSKGIDRFKLSQQETAKRIKRLTTELNTRDLIGIPLAIYYKNTKRTHALDLYYTLIDKGMSEGFCDKGEAFFGPKTICFSEGQDRAALWLIKNVDEFKDFTLMDGCAEWDGIMINM